MKTISVGKHCRLIEGDSISALRRVRKKSCKLIVTSPPYNIGKEYERDSRLSLPDYLNWVEKIIDKLCERVTDDGSICWQTGNFVDNGEVFPLDLYFYQMFKDRGFKLRNRVIWHFNFGLNATRRFSGRYETLLWFTKSDSYTFNLDPVRVDQLYPGKRHPKKKGEKAGLPSGNPKGKNPSDFWEFGAEEAFLSNPMWDFPNVKSKHPEKTTHPCQFPAELAERCVLAFTNENDLVLDPFLGSGTTAIAALKYKRKAVGIDRDSGYITLARDRVNELKDGSLPLRPMGKPVKRPNIRDKVARRPEEWEQQEGTSGKEEIEQVD